MNISVIGAGLGGLSAAAILASRGYTVDLFEQNETVGGKIQEVKIDGFRFDTGPSLLTMPFVLEQVFEQCGRKASDYLKWRALEPLCRYRFADETVFTHFSDPEKTRNELMRIAPEDVDVWEDFLDYSAGLYRRTSESFLFNPLQRFRDLSAKNIPDLLRIDALTTVSRRVDDHFSSPRLRQLFKRFPTCNGSSPYRAPATLNMISYVEMHLGGYHIQGGMYRLAKALLNLANDCGVKVHTDIPIDLIVPDPANKRTISGVMINGSLFEADAVIANCDAIGTYLRLLPENAISRLKKRKISRMEPSSSCFVVMLGINRTYKQLEHLNVFFSNHYEDEFRSVFEQKELPVSPTILLINTSRTDPNDAPPGCSNILLHVNAPCTEKYHQWHEWKETYTDHIIHTLEDRGLDNLRESVVVRNTITPADFERWYGANRGSIYGNSSNTWNAALNRPRNKSPWFDNLYLCGSSTHPGGGIPMVLQSALNVGILFDRQKKA